MRDAEDSSLLPAEARARKLIDEQLTRAGWKVQDKKDLNLFAGQGIAVREAVMKPGHGRVDYLDGWRHRPRTILQRPQGVGLGGGHVR